MPGGEPPASGAELRRSGTFAPPATNPPQATFITGGNGQPLTLHWRSSDPPVGGGSAGNSPSVGRPPRFGPRVSTFLGVPPVSRARSDLASSIAIPVAQAGPVRDLMPWPVPIKPLPMPEEAEPTVPVPREVHDARVAELKEVRRQAVEAGTILNRVVYDSIHFVPACVARVPGGGLLFESRFESGNLRRAIHVQTQEVRLLLYNRPFLASPSRPG